MSKFNFWNLFERYTFISTYWYNHSSDLRAAAAAVNFSLQKKNSDQIGAEYGFGKGFDFGVACSRIWIMLAGLSLDIKQY
jgi:hypothetical protein